MAADEFVNIEVDADSGAMAQTIYDALADAFPGWEASPGNLETFIVDGVAALFAEVADLMAVAGEEIFANFGRTIAQLPPIEAAPATATSTWTMKDSAGYTIPVSTLVGIEATGDTTVAFEVMDEVVVPPGSTVTAAGEVGLRAVVDGEEGNDLTGEVGLIDARDFVSDIEIVDGPDGGVDAEDPTDYLDRLRSELELMSPRPILPEHFARLALRNGNVERALAIDGWNPTADTTDNERYVGLALVDEDGEDVDSDVKTEVQERLDAMREINFIVEVGEPEYNTIDVSATVRCHTSNDPVAVDAFVTAAITDYLLPVNWGRLWFGNRISETGWVNQTVVRYFDLVRLIESQQGVDYIESLTVEGGTSDVNLTGTVPLTRPGTIAVTANAAT